MHARRRCWRSVRVSLSGCSRSRWNDCADVTALAAHCLARLPESSHGRRSAGCHPVLLRSYPYPYQPNSPPLPPPPTLCLPLALVYQPLVHPSSRAPVPSIIKAVAGRFSASATWDTASFTSSPSLHRSHNSIAVHATQPRLSVLHRFCTCGTLDWATLSCCGTLVCCRTRPDQPFAPASRVVW
jgi:hypothetical protein